MIEVHKLDKPIKEIVGFVEWYFALAVKNEPQTNQTAFHFCIIATDLMSML